MAGVDRGEVVFRRATGETLNDVLRVLDEAAGWLRSRGVSQWPPRFEPAWVAGAVSRGETWLVEVERRVAATVTVDRSDPLWADLPGAAEYVHRLAVCRWAAGLGAGILDWAADGARRRGAEALRLDCVRTNGQLRAYYEGRGFEYRGDAPVEWPSGSDSFTWVSRYERALAPAR